MEYGPLQKKREGKDVRLYQAQNYLKMIVEKAELGDKEDEKYWRERTIERLEGAFIGPEGWDDWTWNLLYGGQENYLF